MMPSYLGEHDFERLKVKEYTYWQVYLHPCQNYLGRMYLLNEKTKAQDFIDLDFAERQEFFELGIKIKRVLADLFSPDKMNYAALSNVFEKLHVHFIPRYKTHRFFAGLEFMDKKWGENYAPYDKDFQISWEVMDELKGLIQTGLEKFSTNLGSDN